MKYKIKIPIIKYTPEENKQTAISFLMLGTDSLKIDNTPIGDKYFDLDKVSATPKIKDNAIPQPIIVFELTLNWDNNATITETIK